MNHDSARNLKGSDSSVSFTKGKNHDSINTKKLNNFKVSKIKLPSIEKKKVRGSELLPLFSNSFICAKKNSGKSTVIWNVLKKCADKETILDLFVSTIEKDRSWIQMVTYFRNKGLTVNTHTSTIGDAGEDLIQAIIDDPIQDDEESESEEEDLKYIAIETTPAEKTPKKRKPSKLAQRRIVVLDDIGNELSKPAVSQLLKINRHLKCKVILSTQYLNDLSPMARRQIDVWLLFGGLKKNKLSQVIRDCDTSLDYDRFEEVYKYATQDKYNFMYLDCATDTYRKNFNEQIIN